jgi:S1-C subfamily serine protease
VPIDAVASSASQIIASGRVVRPVLGIALAPDQATEVLGVRGVLVLDARPGGPAAAAGVRGTKRDASGRLLFGDVIVGFNGAAVKSSGELYKALDGAAVGDDVALAVLRGDGRETVTVKLGASSS